MPERVYLGLDIGSSGIRAVAITPEGRQAARARRPRAGSPMSLLEFERDLDLEGIWRRPTGCSHRGGGVPAQPGCVGRA